MVYIYVRDLDKVVLGIYQEPITPADGVTEYYEAWNETHSWWRFKIVRNDDGTFTNTNEEQMETELI